MFGKLPLWQVVGHGRVLLWRPLWAGGYQTISVGKEYIAAIDSYSML